MQIENNKVVQLHYTITEAEGQELMSTRESDPVTYLHGHNNMFTGVEESLQGKTKGDKLKVTLPPEKTFGTRLENAQQRLSKKYFKQAGKIRAGDAVPLQTKEGVKLVTIVKVGHSAVDIDTNHPYAGKTLVFDLEVVDVREAAPEEISHGHVHGPGGHHH